MKLLAYTGFILFMLQGIAMAQFPGPAGSTGSSAIHKDSSIFVAWGQTCTVQRGYQDIADTSLGFTTTGDSTMAIGHADGIQVVSLGDGGSAIVSFEHAIKNGPGFDFAVFENGFIDEFLELAFVEVSSDGVNFFRFKATSNTQTDVQMGPFDYNADASLMNNLAGKYRAMYGTPFDLEEMIGIQGLNTDSITHVKIIDVVGSINPLYGSYDQYNNIINEHYPTPYPQGGFDLDAVGVIHQQVSGINENKNGNTIQIYPNPFYDVIKIHDNLAQLKSIEIIDINGKKVYQSLEKISETLDLNELERGIYFIQMNLKNGTSKFEKLIKAGN